MTFMTSDTVQPQQCRAENDGALPLFDCNDCVNVVLCAKRIIIPIFSPRTGIVNITSDGADRALLGTPHFLHCHCTGLVPLKEVK